ncbi:MAG: hypothetical protein A3E01_05855 [Gammaproteobacteria bacterium RIFCSPHIGHO2_12_FULL_63_22]|nr:MAG: hypothetical protein A3E01_05855 [Gammaproteobacteria bacterium RIFCSPHIGHO2_12_FULL_63_22]
MSNDEPAEPIIAHWPSDWPGQQFVELDNLGDPGVWLDSHISTSEELLFGADDRDSATDLAADYIAAAASDYFPLPTEFGMDEDEMREILIQEFVGFIQEWRRRTVAERKQAEG